MASKVHKLLNLICGSHVMGDDGLRDYHAAKAAIQGNLKRDQVDKLNAIRAALKNHRVMVSLRADSIRVYRPDTNAEFLI